MTFEEFFKKKRISLDLLQNSEPALFAEFKNHYGQMGEKSFDHTKKYLFNPLRGKYPTPPEIKVEKVHIENQLAEQTITESLIEATAPAANTGFKPRFKAAMAAKPTEEQPAASTATPEEEPAAATTPAVGFKPRFNAARLAKPAEEKLAEPEVEKETPIVQLPAEEAPKAVGFKPRFNAAKISKPAIEEKPTETEMKLDEPMSQPSAGDAPKPVGFKSRFNAAKMKPKDPEE